MSTALTSALDAQTASADTANRSAACLFTLVVTYSRLRPLIRVLLSNLNSLFRRDCVPYLLIPFIFVYVSIFPHSSSPPQPRHEHFFVLESVFYACKLELCKAHCVYENESPIRLLLKKLNNNMFSVYFLRSPPSLARIGNRTCSRVFIDINI